jgi:hypothetical protein
MAIMASGRCRIEVFHGAGWHLDVRATKEWLRDLAPIVSALPEAMREEGVPTAVIEACAERIRRTGEALAQMEE